MSDPEYMKLAESSLLPTGLRARRKAEPLTGQKGHEGAPGALTREKKDRLPGGLSTLRLFVRDQTRPGAFFAPYATNPRPANLSAMSVQEAGSGIETLAKILFPVGNMICVLASV